MDDRPEASAIGAESIFPGLSAGDRGSNLDYFSLTTVAK
jgi:hypothetical protein